MCVYLYIYIYIYICRRQVAPPADELEAAAGDR